MEPIESVWVDDGWQVPPISRSTMEMARQYAELAAKMEPQPVPQDDED
jgi:hypothetical protein